MSHDYKDVMVNSATVNYQRYLFSYVTPHLQVSLPDAEFYKRDASKNKPDKGIFVVFVVVSVVSALADSNIDKKSIKGVNAFQ